MIAKQLIGGLVVMVCASFLLALVSGTMVTPWQNLLSIMTSDANPLLKQVILELRLPRALAALAVGGLLSLSGA